MQKNFLDQREAGDFLERGKINSARHSTALQNIGRQVRLVVPPVKEIGVSAVLRPQQDIPVRVLHGHAIAAEGRGGEVRERRAQHITSHHSTAQA